MKIPFPHYCVALALPLLLFLAGCASEPSGAAGDGGRLTMNTSVPMRTLNAMYLSREALISLADGSAENPDEAYAKVLAAIEPLNVFSQKIDALAGSFNDSDYLYFWNQLAGFGTLYNINTGTLSANRLRAFENSLRSFENDVHELNRVYSDYMILMGQLIGTLGPDTSIAEVRQYIPLVNAIIAKTVELDVLIKDFSQNLFAISRQLSSLEAGSHF